MGRSLKVLVAPNAFKGSLSGPEAALAMARGVRDVFPGAETVILPISDGGDGLIDALLSARGGKRIQVAVKGPLGERRKAAFARLKDGAAVVEMALASGLALVPPAKRDALKATSYGTGQLIAAAAKAGAKTIYVGLGGSATNDGGAGLAQALGYRLLDSFGRDLLPGVAPLLDLARIERPKKKLKAKIFAVTDVVNPLLGPKGSARVYGPQKGASPAQVKIIERALERLAFVVKRDLGVSVGKIPGGGAAGGLGAGLVAFLNARIEPGADFVLNAVGAKKALAGSDYALTGEGRLDRTSLFGKAPVALAKLAQRVGVPAVGICGALEASAKTALKRAGFARVVTLAQAGARGAASMTQAAKWARKAATLAVKGLALTALLCAPVFATDVDWALLDKLYFSRDVAGNLEKTVERLEPLAKDRDPQALWRLGRSMIRTGERKNKRKDKLADFIRAEALLKDAVELMPKDAEIHFWYGVSMGRRGQAKGLMSSLGVVKPLRKEMETVLALDPKHGGAHRVLGELLTELPGFAGGDKKKALLELEQAVALSPRHTSNYAPLAEAYAKAGRTDDAKKTLVALLAVTDPADPAEAPRDFNDGRALLEKIK